MTERLGKIRVLCVDYWTKGVHNFKRLIDADRSGQAEYLLLHLGSYRDPRAVRVELIDGLACVDISAYRGMDLLKILESLRPDVVIGLNISSLFDRAVFLTCRKLGVPAVFLQHGAWGSPDTFDARVRAQDKGFTLADRIRRIPKFVRVLPWYLKARQVSVLDPSVWRLLWRTALYPMSSHFLPVAPEELWPAAAYVMNQDTADIIARNHQIPRDRIRVVGNPELDVAIARRTQPLDPWVRAALVRSVGLDPAIPIACYLEDGFVAAQNFLGWTRATLHSATGQLYEACRCAGVQLLVRPHPSTDSAAIEEALEGKDGCAVSRALTLIDSVDISSMVVGTLSTTLDTAFVLGKEILVPTWFMQGQVHLCPYLRGNAARSVESPEELSRLFWHVGNGGALRPVPGTPELPIQGGVAARVIAEVLELGAMHACADRIERISPQSGIARGAAHA